MSSPLLSDVDAAEVASEVVLLRSAMGEKTILILEGPSDEKVLSNFVQEDQCETVISWGRSNALGAMQILRERGVPGVLSVVDSDYDEFLGVMNGTADVIVTDEHDLETMLIRSKAFDKVVRELGSRSKLANLRLQALDPRLLIRDAIHPLGILRLYSLKRSLSLKFDGLRFRFLNKKTLKTDLDAMLREVHAHSNMLRNSYDEARRFVDCWLAKDYDPWRMCCGHDLAFAFGKALQSLIGSQNAHSVSCEQIESQLRLAYDLEDFRATKLFKSIRVWEQDHPPFICLRDRE